MVTPTPAPEGKVRIICPDGHIELVDSALTDDELAARFEADHVWHAPLIDWRYGVCVDGPLEGKRSWTSNQIGCTVRSGPTAGPWFTYELVVVGEGEEPAQLRFVEEIDRQTD